MAIRDRSNTKSSQVPPRMGDSYVVRVKEAKFGQSGKGRPQIKLTTEICEPLEQEIDGRVYSLSAFDVPFYIGIDNDRNIDALLDFHKLLGLPETVDEENPDTDQYVGICFKVYLQSTEKTQQRKTEDGKYETVTEDGKPVSFGWQIMGDITKALQRRADLENTGASKF